jgi:hypothetical protein
VRCSSNATYCNGADAGPLDTNGGGFVTGASGTDMSVFNWKNATSGCTTAGVNCYSKTADLSTTDGASASGSPTHITSATGAYDANIVGNIIYITGGSITAGWYEVTTRTSATDITLDRTAGCAGTCTGITVNIGGALASPGQASAVAVTGNIVYIQNTGADGASVYSITTASTQVSGGTFGGSVIINWQGYTSTRSLGNSDARPVIQTNVTTATTVGSTSQLFQNLIFDGNKFL